MELPTTRRNRHSLPRNNELSGTDTINESRSNGAEGNQITKTPSPVPGYSQRTIAFFALVALSVTTQTAFKVSQRGGKYEYNTISAMSVVELIKLLMSLFHHYRASECNISECRLAFGRVPKRLYQAYFLLALSYALYNQIIFAVMDVAEPGTFSLFKSFTPILVSLMNWCIAGQSLTQMQWYCVVIQVLGIIPVILSSDCENGAVRFEYSTNKILLMIFAIVMGSLNTVYNATVIKKESTPVAVQNIMLYTLGVVINLTSYFMFSSTDKHFFYGYGHFGVLLLLFLNSFVGIAITMIYKYGDAVLKTLTQPLSSAVLVYISYLAFGMSLDVVKAAGAGVVVVATLMYLRLPSPPSETSAGTNGKRHRSTAMVSFLIFLCIAGTTTHCIRRAATIPLLYESKTSKSVNDNPRAHSDGQQSYTDWNAALRVLGAATSPELVPNFSIEDDALTFTGLMNAYLMAPHAVFGTLLTTCAKAFDQEQPCDWYAGPETTNDLSSIMEKSNNNANKEMIFPLTEDSLRSHKVPPLMIDDVIHRRGGNRTTDDAENNYGTGENIVWILAAHIENIDDFDQPIRMVEEGMRSRMRLYPGSHIIVSDNGSPSEMAQQLRELVETKIPGTHWYVRNPPPSGYEHGAYYAGLKVLKEMVPDPPENELVILSQATTVLMRPLPLAKIFRPGCDIRPIYGDCCGRLPTPPCNETKQADWFKMAGSIDDCSFCANGTCHAGVFNGFGRYKDRICDQTPLLGIMHATMVTTGSYARDTLYEGLSFELPCKVSEVISSYWLLAGTTQPDASCSEGIDIDFPTMPNYFLFKAHAGGSGWGQSLWFAFVKWLQTLDINKDGLVAFSEMMASNESSWKTSTQRFCKEAFHPNRINHAVRDQFLQVGADWHRWCTRSDGSTNMQEFMKHVDNAFIPIICKTAREECKSGGILGSFYSSWGKE